MKTEQGVFSTGDGWNFKENTGIAKDVQLVFVFGHKELLKKAELIDKLRSRYPNGQLVGCSTAGEIAGAEISDDRIVATAVYFEKTQFKIIKQDVSEMQQSYQVGEKLGNAFVKEGLKHLLVISEGLNINGTELTNALNKVFDDKLSITGGLAGDQANFEETVIVYNNEIKSNMVVAIGFYGENIEFGYGSMGGWDSFGVDREVTRAEANVLYELDGQPALELYKKYLGRHAEKLPASALLFPLSLRMADANTAIVRTVLAVNEDDGSMVFAGDIPQGEYVRLMKANFDKLVDGAFEAAEMSKISLKQSDADLVILISCVGRKLVLKQRVEEELEAIQEVIGERVTTTGFYSYGEISPVKPFEKHCELHNQTMTITLLKEN